MAFAVSWIGVKGRSEEQLLGVLDLADTGQTTEEVETQYSLARLPDGWLIFYSTDLAFASPRRLAILSEGATAIGCQIEEHVMFSEARRYENGEEQWRITSNAENGPEHLEIVGQAPALAVVGPQISSAQRVARSSIKHDDEATSFDIPIDIAANACGFRYDHPPGQPVFSELRVTKPSKPPRRGLFGGR